MMLETDEVGAQAARDEARERANASSGGPGRLPDFLITGAAKCATSTLFDYLKRHPAVFGTEKKEPDFFDPDMTWDKGLDWYRSLFADAKDGEICGEASTHYTRYPQVKNVPDRMFEIIPNVKLIYMMRHPIDRAHSHYVHRHTKEIYRGQPFIRTFEEFIEEEPMCVDSSEYMVQIRDFLRLFPREQMLFLLLDDMKKDPGAVVRKTCQFLEIDDSIDLLAEGPVFSNVASDMLEHRVRMGITGPLKKNPIVRMLASITPRFLRNIAYEALRKKSSGQQVEDSYKPPAMLPETREKLAGRYREGTLELAEFIDQDLSHWLD